MEQIEKAPPKEPLSDEEKAELKELRKISAGMLTWGEARRIRQLELKA